MTLSCQFIEKVIPPNEPRLYKSRLAGLVFAFLLWFQLPAFSQWSTGSGGAIYYSGGNVGVGTSSPGATLTVLGGTYDTGIQIQSSNTYGTGLQLANTATNGHYYALFSSGPGDFLGAGGFGIYDDTAAAYRLTITPSGNVGINTVDPQNTLSVNGTVQAKEVVVNTGWSDFVFAPDYPLASLNEIKAFVSTNHHLPDIPSAADVEKNGVNVGEMEARLLAKVEELTLHMIAAEERSEKLERQNRLLQERLERMEARVKEAASTAESDPQHFSPLDNARRP